MHALEAELNRLTDRGLSAHSRYGHVALLLVALLMCVFLSALLVSEPAMPRRTEVLLVLMLGIGISWVTYATWVLRHRRPLLANHRIVAGRMAVGFTTLFFGGTLIRALFAGGKSAYGATVVGGAMLMLAFLALRDAHRSSNRLRLKRQELERRLR